MQRASGFRWADSVSAIDYVSPKLNDQVQNAGALGTRRPTASASFSGMLRREIINQIGSLPALRGKLQKCVD